MRNIKAVVLLCLLLTNLFAIKPVEHSEPLKDLDKVSLQLQWKHQFQFAGYYIAKEKGFYKDAGFDVDIKEFQYGMNVPNEIVNGKSTFGVGRPTLIVNRSQGDKVTLLASVFQSSPNILLATKDSHINTIADMKHKRVMVTGDAKQDATIMSMIFSQGLTLSDLSIQEHTFNLNDLIDKKTDVMSSYISNEPFLLKSKGIQSIVFNPKDYGFDFYNDILFTKEDYVINNFQQTQKFTQASLKGWEYAFNHIEETVELILQKYNTQQKSKEALIFEANELKKLAYYQTDKLGEINVNKIKKIFNYYQLMGFAKKDIDFTKFIYDYNENIQNLLSSQEILYLKSKQKITMCIDPSWMPFEQFDEKGNYVGMSADYFKLFEKSLNTKFEVIKTASWTQSIKFAKQRKCDIFSLAMQTPSRKKYMNFTTPYLRIPLVLATKQNVQFINQIEDIKDHKIGMPKGYAFLEILKNKYPTLKIVEVENVDEGLEKVRQNEIFAYVGTLASIGYKLQTKYTGELKITGKIGNNWELGIGVRNDDITLLNILQKAVNNVTIDEKNTILNKWISVRYEQSVDYSFIWKILFVVFIILLIFIYKQYMLKRYINDMNELIDSTMEAIIVSKNGICTNTNQSAVELFNYNTKDEIIGKKLLEFISTESQNIVKENLKLQDTKPYEGVVLTKTNTKLHALIRGHNLANNGLRITSFIDITQLKKLESQSKLASMGEMIGNIAHQWRQPLSVISTAVTGMQLKKEIGKLEDKEFDEMCVYINDNAQYLSQTIDDFRNFIKGDNSAVKFDLQTNIDSFIKLINSVSKANNIQIIVDIEKNTKIIGYPNELIQCFINIFNNSKDAFNENNQNENRYIFINTKLIENNLVITFKDSAGGIPQNILPRIFEPYFTTKHKSNGTGLGLHMSYNLITNHMHGTIEALNEEFMYNNKTFKGAVFSITIPYKS